jgi:hypothetical protein
MAMTIVNNILKQMPAVGQPQRTFLVMLCSTILALRGRVNFRHLRRYCDDSERTIARQFRRSVDWPDFHQRVITTALDPQAKVISAQDASVMPKRGTQTFGLGHFVNGCAGRAARGLAISTLAVVDVTPRCAFTRAVAQTPPTCATAATQDQEATRVDGSTQPRRAPHHRLPAWVTSHAVDGYFAKKKSIDAVVDLRRHPITKRRGEADGRFLCTGPHPRRRGAHRQDDGTVHWQDLSRFEALGTLAEAEHVHLYTAVVWHVTRKRKLRVVVLINRHDPATPRDRVLASTALALDGHKRLELYGARFQIECLFRASKQFTGLTDGQARAEAPLSLQFNASLATLKLVRAEDLNAQAGAEPRVFSMASGKPCQFNERLLDLCIEKFALDPNGVKNHPSDDELRIYGAIAA